MSRPEKVVSAFRRGGWHQTHQEWRESASQRVVRSMWSCRRHKQNLLVTRFRTALLLRRRSYEPARLAKLYRVPPLPRRPQLTASEHCSLDPYFALLWQWNVIAVVVVSVAYCVVYVWNKNKFVKTSFYSLCTTHILYNVILDDIQIRVPIRR